MEKVLNRRNILLRLRKAVCLHDAAYIVTQDLGGLWEDACALLEESVIHKTLRADVVPELHRLTDDVIAPVDRARTLIKVADLITWLEPIKRQLEIQKGAQRPSSSDQCEDKAELSSKEKERLLKHIGSMALLLAKQSNRYSKGTGPSGNAIADAVIELMEELPDSNINGVGNSSLRESISNGLKLLKK